MSLLSSNTEKRDFSILVASRSAEAIKHIGEVLSTIPRVAIKPNHICNGHSDPVYGFTQLPDLLVFWVGEHWDVELSEFIARPAQERPPMIICADHNDPQLMRLSMKAGALDYLTAPIEEDDLIAATRSVMADKKANQEAQSASIIGVMNAKGGSGASFIACNIADIMKEASHLNVALLGLDIQFGSLSGYLDLDAKYGLLDALDNINDMDNTALQGYMVKHSSGLHVLDVKPDELLMSEDVDTEGLGRLFSLLSQGYSQVVVDLPRQIDNVTRTAIDCVDKLMIVTQQSISHLHDTKRLLHLLRRDLGLSSERIVVVVNRYSKSNELTLSDISQALKHDNILTVPNSFEQVSESINGGEPLYQGFKRAAITKALLHLEESLLGESDRPEQKSIGNFFNRFMGS